MESNNLATIIAIFGNKGGIGKTTTAYSLAIALAKRSKKVLLVDNGNQMNLSKAIIPETDALAGQSSIYEVYADQIKKKEITPTVLPTKYENLFLIAGHKNLDDIESLVRDTGRADSWLERYFKKQNLLENFDYIIIDNEPNKSIFTRNAVSASDKVILPIEYKYFSLDSIPNTITFLQDLLMDKKIDAISILNKVEDQKKVTREKSNEQLKHIKQFIWSNGNGNFKKIPLISKVENALYENKTHFDSGFKNEATTMFDDFAYSIINNEVNWQEIEG